MGRKLKVLVSGTGFAGQGHTDAFRNAGAEVVGSLKPSKLAVMCFVINH